MGIFGPDYSRELLSLEAAYLKIQRNVHTGGMLKAFLNCSTIQEFKRKIKQRNGDSCTCRLCRVFIKDLSSFRLLSFVFFSVLLVFFKL